VTRWTYTRGYVPEAQKSRDETIEWCEKEIAGAMAYMLHYGSRDEILKWVGEIYDRVENNYQDWLSTQ
jgi:hypothetical protein